MVAASAEYFIFHDGFYAGFCLFSCFRDDNAFAQCQTVCFDNGGNGCCFQISQRVFRVVKHFVSRCRNVVFLHEIFGEHFAAFQNRCVFVGAEARHADGFQCVNCPQYQRIVRSYHCEINGFFLGKCHNAVNILCTNIHTDCILCDTAVAGQCVQFCHIFVFLDLLHDGMFSATAAYNHNFHRLIPPVFSLSDGTVSCR